MQNPTIEKGSLVGRETSEPEIPQPEMAVKLSDAAVVILKGIAGLLGMLLLVATVFIWGPLALGYQAWRLAEDVIHDR